MKLTNKQLKQIIKEELEAVMTEMKQTVEEKLTHALMMKIWDELGGAYAMKDKALEQAQFQVQQLKLDEVPLEWELKRIESQKKPTKRVRPYKRSWHGDDGSSNLPHQSTWDE